MLESPEEKTMISKVAHCISLRLFFHKFISALELDFWTPRFCLKLTEPSFREWISLWFVVEPGKERQRLFNAVSSEALLAYTYGYPALNFLGRLPPNGAPLAIFEQWILITRDSLGISSFGTLRQTNPLYVSYGVHWGYLPPGYKNQPNKKLEGNTLFFSC